MKQPLRVVAVKGHEISTYRLTSGRCMVVWYDSEGRRQRRSRSTLKEAEELVSEISGALKDKVNGVITLDDRHAYNLARELVEPFGYTVLQAVREWEKTKAPYRGTGDVIAEMIAAKRREDHAERLAALRAAPIGRQLARMRTTAACFTLSI